MMWTSGLTGGAADTILTTLALTHFSRRLKCDVRQAGAPNTKPTKLNSVLGHKLADVQL